MNSLRIHAFPAVAATLAAGALLPAAALAAGAPGVVIAVNRQLHVVQVAVGRQRVRPFHYGASLSKVRPGSRISLNRSGRRIAKVAAHPARASRVRFVGSLLRIDGDDLVVRPRGDRYPLKLRPMVVEGADGPTLQRGTHLRVTESFGRRRRVVVQVLAGGSWTELASSGSSGSGRVSKHAGIPLQMTGTVVQLDQGSFVVQPDRGSPATFQITPSELYKVQLYVCGIVTVSYGSKSTHVTAQDVNYQTDNLSGVCNDPGSPNFTGTADAVGPITELTLNGLTVSTPNGPMTFRATIDLTDSYLVGDTVDVAYSPLNGALVASDINYDDQDAIGTVTSVNGSSLTIDNSSTGQIQTFTNEPGNGPFDGIAVGQQVDVAWYYSNGYLVVDSVSVISGTQ